MNNKCNCYNVIQKRKYTYHPFTGERIAHDVNVAVCNGTKEQEECSCNGDRCKCDFYPEVREKAKQNITFENAIAHFKYGISHDIFKEPVTTYSKMAVEALEKQIPKNVVREGNDESDWVHCPSCDEVLGVNLFICNVFYENDWKPIYCHKCGQPLTWE